MKQNKSKRQKLRLKKVDKQMRVDFDKIFNKVV